MKRVLKTFLLWLLLAALPIQGMAAVIKASCGPKHHSSLSVVMNAETRHHHDGTGHHDHAADHAVIVADQMDSLSAPDESADANQSQQSGYCSACATCCTGTVAPPFASVWVPEHSRSETKAVFPIPLFTGHIPASLERPPRHIFA
jgi:hypothetical protein